MFRWLEALTSKLATRRWPLVRVADLRDGWLVRVVGRARGYEGPLPLPLSGGDAATFSLRVYEYRRRARMGQTWGTERVLLEDIDRGPAFWIDDGTGLARVERQGWSELVSTAVTTVGRGPFTGRPQASLERYAEFFGDDARVPFRGFGGGYEYQEQAIPEGARVEVTGLARQVGEIAPASGAGSYRTAPKLFVIEPPSRDKLRIRLLRDVG